MGLLDDTGAKGEVRSHKTRAEKLDKFFVLVLTVRLRRFLYSMCSSQQISQRSYTYFR